MCLIRYIKDFLFPTNILGKKMRTFELPMVHPPYTDKTFNITWTGDRLDIKYMRYIKPSTGIATRKEPKELNFEHGNLSNIELIVTQRSVANVRIYTSNVYLKCTNVTYLEINGERYI